MKQHEATIDFLAVFFLVRFFVSFFVSCFRLWAKVLACDGCFELHSSQAFSQMIALRHCLFCSWIDFSSSKYAGFLKWLVMRAGRDRHCSRGVEGWCRCAAGIEKQRVLMLWSS